MQGIHNRTTSVFNPNPTNGEFLAKKSVTNKKIEQKKASEYIVSMN